MNDTACSITLQNQSPPAMKSKKSLGSRYSHKIASIFARNTRATHQNPFNRLPYDVRVIVYRHLETSLPLAPRFECVGFYLSCRQFKREIEEFAHDRLRSLCARIENTSNFRVAINLGSDELRSISVVLPYTAFDDFDGRFSCPKWNREVLSSLHPLFAYPFDTLRIEIDSEQCPIPNIPRYQVEHTLRSLIRDLGNMVECSNIYNLQSHSMHATPDKVDKIFKPDVVKDAVPYPSAEVRARRICLSWDCRPSPGDQIPLRGRIIYAETSQNTDKRRFRVFHARKPRKPRNPLSPANFERFMVYELWGAEHPAGEIGIVSPVRWRLHTFEGCSVTKEVDSFDLRKGTIVSSKGFGMELENGVPGVRDQELEDEEIKRHAAALAEKFENYVRRAYMDEGHMPD